MRGALGDIDLFIGFRLPNAVTDCNFETRVEDHPKFGPPVMVLEGKRATRVDRDDLYASGLLVRKLTEFSPWPDVFEDPAPEILLS
jgi:hypothetical protein